MNFFTWIAALAGITVAAAQTTELSTNTDYGSFFCATLRVPNQPPTMKGIIITVDKSAQANVCFDEDLIRTSIGWVGGWLKTGNYLTRIEHPQPPEINGRKIFSTKASPGWIKGTEFIDPRPIPQGPLPRNYAHYRGLYRGADGVVLSYTVGRMNVLERPGYSMRGDLGVFTRTFHINKLEPDWAIFAAEATGEPIVAGTALIALEGNKCVAIAARGNTATRLEFANGKLLVRLAGDPGVPADFEVSVWSGPASQLSKFVDAHAGPADLHSPEDALKGGPARWPQPVTTKGSVGTGDGPYVVDVIGESVPNPWHTKTYFGGLDFLPDGRAAICTFHGDVWIVDGIDEKLDKLTWRRFAGGLFQPLGVRVVDGQIYVTCRDAIVRLYDLNGDGEADFYENFNNDCVVTANYHEFALDLHTDSAGNFYYFKGSPWTPDVQSPHQGTCLKLPKDGSALEVYATGFRAPNGAGMGPGDILTVSDNEGHWMPSSKVNLVRKGGFYGMTPAAQHDLFLTSDTNFFTANPSDPEARERFHIKGWDAGAQTPTNYDQPICWLPKAMDNSSGGQVWSTSGKWGALNNHMLFMSYGRGTLFEVMTETVDGAMQGGMIRFPFKFNTGIMRGRENPRDGQIYLCGLRGWQTDGVKDGGFYRVRYTGKPAHMPIELHVKKEGVQITFSDPLDEAAAKDLGSYSVEQWNYIYSGNYGSPEVSPDDPNKKGHDKVEVKAVTLSADKKTILLQMPVRPVMQMRIKFKLKAADGAPLNQEIYNTIHKVPAH